MRRLLILTALLAGAMAGPAAAGGASAQTGPVADCNAHGQLTRAYTVTELRKSLSTMPADVKEYTDCYDVIQRALLAKLGRLPGGGGPNPPSAGSGGSFLPTPVIVLLAVLALVAAGFGVVALRRRRTAGGGVGT